MLGGWDPIAGIQTAVPTRDLAEGFTEMVPAMASDPLLGPMLVEHDAEALTRCLLTLFDDALPSLEVLNDAGVPLLLYCGAEDPYRTNMELAAGQLRFELTVVQGDHIHALADPSIVDPVCRFFETRMED